MKTQQNEWAYREYIESGRWKCSQSPTGAHYWIGSSILLQCKYCGAERKINGNWRPKKNTKLLVR